MEPFDSSAACCIAWARVLMRRSPSSRLLASEYTRAAYSPRLNPAAWVMVFASEPCSRLYFFMVAIEAMKMAG